MSYGVSVYLLLSYQPPYIIANTYVLCISIVFFYLTLYNTVAKAMSGIVYAAEQKNITVTVSCPENLYLCHDSKWTAEALFNLLDHAVKYTPPGGSIRVSVECGEMYTQIKVADTGKGIPESSQAAVFRHFYR